MSASSHPIASVDRIARINEILKREIAELIEKRGVNEGDFLLSVTKVHCSSCLKNATVYVSIMGATEAQEEKIMKNLLRLRPEIQRNVAKHVVLKYTPVLQFTIDRNIAAGDRVLEILRELEENQ